MREQERFKPKKGDYVWIFANYGIAVYRQWNHDYIDLNWYFEGNVHPTKEAAEQWGKEQEEKK